jgi:hypothetical protein
MSMSVFSYRGIKKSLHYSGLSSRLHAANHKSNEGCGFVQLILVEFVDIGDEVEEVVFVLGEEFGKLLIRCRCFVASGPICFNLTSIVISSQGFGLRLLLPAFQSFSSTINRHGWLIYAAFGCWPAVRSCPAVGTRLIDFHPTEELAVVMEGWIGSENFTALFVL